MPPWAAENCVGGCFSISRSWPGCALPLPAPMNRRQSMTSLSRKLRRKRRTVSKRMTEANEHDANEHEQKRLTLRSGGTLGLRRPVESGQVRQSFSHGRSKAVTVEVRKKRAVPPGTPEPGRGDAPAAPAARAHQPSSAPSGRSARPAGGRTLTAEEHAT